VPVIVDEAYFEFTGTTAVPLIAKHPNVIVLRTFSKAFAMAGLRLGYVVADPAVIGQLGKIRNPFDINTLAAVAGQAQLGALSEVAAYVREVMTVVKPMTVEFFQRHRIPIWPGAANFVLVRPDDCDAVIAALRAAGILVRRMVAAGLTGTFRMSLGTRAEMAEVLDVYAGLLSTHDNDPTPSKVQEV
jgi:histidinol-phosphate aminotransferase